MSSESKCVSESDLGLLKRCLVEGNREQRQRARMNRRRALFISVVSQALAAAALILVPVLGQTERITLPERYTIVPPYAPGQGSHPNTGHAHPVGQRRQVCFDCFNPRALPPVVKASSGTPEPPNPMLDQIGMGFLERPGIPGGSSSLKKEPAPPAGNRMQAPVRRRISEGVQGAQLVLRVEPIYPPLAIQLHREGRVELHAIISIDGTVQSLEVISGDPLLIQSALTAVRAWRYRPTILNGQPVEVDTHINVIYSMNR